MMSILKMCVSYLPGEKVVVPRLLKKGQMQGSRNPDE